MNTYDTLTAGTWTTGRLVRVWTPDDPAEFHRYRTGDLCGSDAGYQRHRAAGETACDDCRAARRRQEKRYRVAR